MSHINQSVQLQFDLALDVHECASERAPAAQCGNRLQIDTARRVNENREQRVLARTVEHEDAHLIETWISARCADSEAVAGAAQPGNTERTYRKEVNRFSLWLRSECDTGLAHAALADCIRYRAFLRNPAPAEVWCSPRGRSGDERGRPFEGPLSARSIRNAIAVLKAFYKFLVNLGVRADNPWANIASPKCVVRDLDPKRSLSCEQLELVQAVLKEKCSSLRAAQLLLALRLLYATGMRLSEITAARCADLRRVTTNSQSDEDESSSPVARESWALSVIGKGGRRREIPVPALLVDQLLALMALAGHVPSLRAEAQRPLLCSWSVGSGPSTPAGRCALSSQSLYRQLRSAFQEAAARLAEVGRSSEAGNLSRASTHWLRHAHASHSLELGVPLDVVQANLGHRSLATTSIYTHADLARRTRETARLGESLFG